MEDEIGVTSTTLPHWETAGTKLRRLLPARTVKVPKAKPPRAAREPRQTPQLAGPDVSLWRVQAFGQATGSMRADHAYDKRQVKSEAAARRAAAALLATFPLGSARVECERWGPDDYLSVAKNRFGIPEIQHSE
jgi:hypothetical protein